MNHTKYYSRSCDENFKVVVGKTKNRANFERRSGSFDVKIVVWTELRNGVLHKLSMTSLQQRAKTKLFSNHIVHKRLQLEIENQRNQYW